MSPRWGSRFAVSTAKPTRDFEAESDTVGAESPESGATFPRRQRHARLAALARVTPLWRGWPGATFLLTASIAAGLSRAPIYPSVSMVRSFGGAGDSISWGMALGSLADHLRYEPSWAPHRAVAAHALDLAQPVVTWGLAFLLARALNKFLVHFPRRSRVGLEIVCRRAALGGTLIAALVLGLDRLLHAGLVRWPLRTVLACVAPTLLGIAALASVGLWSQFPRPRRPASTPWARALRLVGLPLRWALGALLTGVLISALLSLTVPMLSARAGIAPITWPLTAMAAIAFSSGPARRWRRRLRAKGSAAR